MECIISTTHSLSQLSHVLPNMSSSQLHVICLLISPVSTACMWMWWWWWDLPLEWESCPWPHLQRGAVLTTAVNAVSARGEDWRAFTQAALEFWLAWSCIGFMPATTAAFYSWHNSPSSGSYLLPAPSSIKFPEPRQWWVDIDVHLGLSTQPVIFSPLTSDASLHWTPTVQKEA